MKNQIIANNGSIQNVDSIPSELKALYKTVWEISQKVIIEMAADRGAFIDQSQSLNIHIAEPNYGKLTSMHFYAWKQGLKTGMYYLRTKPAAAAIKFTVDKTRLQESNKTNGTNGTAETNGKATNGKSEIEQMKELNQAAMVCSIDNKDDCLMCGS